MWTTEEWPFCGVVCNMENPQQSAEDRAHWYAGSRGVEIVDRLGFGVDGTVYRTTRTSAVKAHDRWRTYCTERDIYLRFRERNVQSIRGHIIPELMDFEDSLCVIEISVVEPPYLIDFAKATIDVAPVFPPGVYEEWLLRKSKDFGGNWSTVVAIMRDLVGLYGVHLTDLNPNNIAFELNDQDKEKPPACGGGSEGIGSDETSDSGSDFFAR